MSGRVWHWCCASLEVCRVCGSDITIAVIIYIVMKGVRSFTDIGRDQIDEGKGRKEKETKEIRRNELCSFTAATNDKGRRRGSEIEKRGGGGERERQRDRETNRQTDKEDEREREGGGHRKRQTDKQKMKQELDAKREVGI